MKILIVKISALGDVVHSLPVLDWIRQAEPTAEIHWLVDERFAPILQDHPDVRRVHPVGLKNRSFPAALQEVMSVGRRLRGEKDDLLLDLQGNSKSGLFSFLSGARRRFGFARDAVREWPNLLTSNAKVSLTPNDFHISDRSLAIARAAFPNGSTDLCAGPLAANPVAGLQVRKKLDQLGFPDSGFLVLHYGTTWSTKLWALAHWRELVKRLAGEGERILLTWGNAEEQAAGKEITAGTEAELWPRGDLPDLVALLGRAALVIGGDTGPIHIAAALATPTVSLYRVTDSRRNGPRGKRHQLLQADLDCSPCLRKSCEQDQACAASISVDKVWQAARGLLDRGYR